MKRISWLLIVPLALAAVSAPMACVENLNFSLGSGGSGATGGSGGAGGESSSTSTTSTSSTSGMAGMGGSPECGVMNGIKDCVVDECNPAVACTNGVCIREIKGENVTTDSQLYGDCKDRVCDINGAITPAANPPDIYDYVDPCYMKTCNDPSILMANNGVTCETPWGNPSGMCHNFKCIDCMVKADCAPTDECSVDFRCVPPACADGLKGMDEADIDCGGTSACPRCAPGKLCMVDTDCDLKCDTATMMCVPPSCIDNVRNGDETATDCGGSCATKCPKFSKCLVPGDCASGVCKVGQCQEPTCRDQTKNQDEAGTDCGGTICLRCPP